MSIADVMGFEIMLLGTKVKLLITVQNKKQC